MCQGLKHLAWRENNTQKEKQHISLYINNQYIFAQIFMWKFKASVTFLIMLHQN